MLFFGTGLPGFRKRFYSMEINVPISLGNFSASLNTKKIGLPGFTKIDIGGLPSFS